MIKGYCPVESHLARSSRGAMLISLIITMVILSVLGAAMLSFFSTSTMSQLGGNSSMRAYYLAESGYRYADSEIAHTSKSMRDNKLESLHDKICTLSGDDGKFHLHIYPYYYVTTADHPIGSTSLNTKVCGGFPPGLVLTSGFLKINDKVYQYTNAARSGSNITFTIPGGTSAISNGTAVYPVSRSFSNRTVTNKTPGNDYIDLEISTGSRNAFPILNGTFKVNGSINPNRIWCYKKRDEDRLEGITPSDDPNGAFELYLSTTCDIVLDKFVKLKSTGIVYSGSDLETKREITYYMPIFEELRGKVTYIETFEGVDLPGSFVGGAGEVGGHEVVDGALHVTTTGESSIDFNWRSTYVDLESVWEDAGYLLSYDLQVKICTYDESYPDNKPPFFMAGISFRKVSTASDTDLYGISFLRGKQIYNFLQSKWEEDSGIPEQLIPPDLYSIPYEYELDRLNREVIRYSKPAIVLWRRTSTGYQWLAYKILASDDCVVYKLNGNSKKLRLKDWSNLQVRVIEARPLGFSGGGPMTFLYGDTITIMRGTTKIGMARVNGTPILTSDNWATNGAAGVLTLSDVVLEDSMSIQLNDDLQVNGVTRARASGTLGNRTNFIRVYYGDTDAHGTPSDSPIDNDRKGNERISASGKTVNWPVDNVSNWAVDNDYLTLVQWTGFNTGVSAETSTVEPNAVIKDSTLQSPDEGDGFDTARPEIALHTSGDTSSSIYFDDVAIQAENRTAPASLPVIQQ